MNTCIAQTSPFHQFDGEYLRKLRSGSSETTEHFVAYFSAILERKLRKYHLSRGSIDDICQETLVRVLNSIHGLRTPGCLGAYVLSVGKNVYREFCRAGSRTSKTAPSEDRFYDTAPDPERLVMNREVRQQIEQTLDRLSPTDRQLLVLALAEGHPRPYICRILNVKPANLPVMLHRAKVRFRNIFAAGATTSWHRHSTFAGSRGSVQGAAA
jgi:RNA polymerase sigma factor (sigma-70 family)